MKPTPVAQKGTRMAKKKNTQTKHVVPTEFESIHVTYGVLAGTYYVHPEVHLCFTPEGEFKKERHGVKSTKSRDDMLAELADGFAQRGWSGRIVLTKAGAVSADEMVQWLGKGRVDSDENQEEPRVVTDDGEHLDGIDVSLD